MSYFGAQQWNGWGESLEANRIGGSRTARVRRTPDGQALDLLPDRRTFQHPWSASMRWDAEAELWEVQLLPGLVNALDPIVPGLKSRVEGEEDVEAALTEGAWIPVRSFRQGLDGTDAVAKKYFEERGVRGDLSDRVTVNAIGGITITEAEDTNPLPPRQLVACDVYLAKARATFAAEVTVVDATGASGQAVDYSVRYDTTQLDQVGTRPRVMIASIFPAITPPTLIDRLAGNYQDEGEDRLHLCTVFLLSPPNWEGRVDASWQPFAQHHVFWNLRHGARNEPPVRPPQPIRFFSGLAGGFGDLIVNQYLALDDALAGQILNAVNNTAPEGQWSLA